MTKLTNSDCLDRALALEQSEQCYNRLNPVRLSCSKEYSLSEYCEVLIRDVTNGVSLQHECRPNYAIWS